MPTLWALWALWTLLAVTTGAHAQLPGLPSVGRTSGDSELRLTQNPAERVKATLDGLIEQQRNLAWAEATGWATELTTVRARIAQLQTLRSEWVLAAAPDAESRRLVGDRLAASGPDPDGVEEDDGPPRDAPRVGAGPDAGPSPDAGATADAGPATDADPSPDAGAHPEASATADAGPEAGPGPDAGLALEAGPHPEATAAPVVPVVAYGDRFLAPGVHPDAVLALDQLLATLAQQERMLVAVQRMLNEEAAQLAAGIGRAEALLQHLDQPVIDPERTAPYGLRETERLALDVHLARIEDALARARQREPLDDDGTEVEIVLPDPPVDAGAELSPITVYRASQTRADQLRDETTQSDQRTGRLAPRLRLLRDAAERARSQRAELDVAFAHRDLTVREQRFEHGRARLRVLPEEVTWTTQRLERSRMLREEQTRLIETELDTLRAAEAKADVRVPISESDETLFTEARLRQKRILLAREQLTFEREKLRRDQFYFDLATHLNGIIDGKAPPAGVFKPYADILDPARNNERHLDLATRCDGWRRARNTAENKRPSPAQRPVRDRLIQIYEGLTDLCMRHDWVLGTEDRLGEIARYHLDQLKWSARGTGWYVARGLLTLLLLVLLVVLNRLLRRATKAVAGAKRPPNPDAGRLTGMPAVVERVLRLRGTVAMLAYLLVSVFCWLYAVILIGRLVWTVPVQWSDLLGWSTATLFEVGEKAVSVWSIAQLLIWWFVGIWIARLIHGFVTQNILGHFALDRGIRDAIGQVVRYLALFVTVALGLASVGIGLGALGLLFGVIGIGIGFGLQNIASNFISGFILLFERPIRRGDFVQVGDLVGEVKDISARATTLETRDAITVIVPNSEFVSSKVINWTLGGKERVRTQVKVGVTYDSDLERVERVLLEQAGAHPAVLGVPPPNVQLTSFGPDALEFTMNVWVVDIRNLPRIVSDLNLQVALAFRANHIAIPFPQRRLHLSPEAAQVFGRGLADKPVVGVTAGPTVTTGGPTAGTSGPTVTTAGPTVATAGPTVATGGPATDLRKPGSPAPTLKKPKGPPPGSPGGSPASDS